MMLNQSECRFGRFLPRHATAALALVLSSASPSLVRGAEVGRSGPARPNVIYVFSDEHRWQSMSFTEMPQVKTPNMDRLAAQGFTFTHCISNYPVCTPHRAILMTGRWPFQTGLIDNNIPLSSNEVTLGKVFKAAGYHTGYIGKWHLGGIRAESFGFDESLIWTGTNNHWKSSYHPAGRPPVVAKGYNATLMTDQALEFIEGSRQRPFFLMLSLNPPHMNFKDAPDPYKALYPDVNSLPRRPNDATKACGTTRPTLHGLGGDTWEEYRGYHAHVSAVDAELGRIMKKLDALGLTENTILVYSSDHGSMLGSHGVGGKRQPYEESIRVPFIIRWPAAIRPETKSDVLFGTIDIMPTLCGLAGLAIPKTCEGQDFSPWLRGNRGPRPVSQFIMHISKKNASGGDKHPAPLFRGVVTERFTYAVFPDRPACLFDNRKDPYQMHNLAGVPGRALLQDRLNATLAQWLKKAQDPFQLPRGSEVTTKPAPAASP
jgi:arylsulfatase A-like enzyme